MALRRFIFPPRVATSIQGKSNARLWHLLQIRGEGDESASRRVHSNKNEGNGRGVDDLPCGHAQQQSARPPKQKWKTRFYFFSSISFSFLLGASAARTVVKLESVAEHGNFYLKTVFQFGQRLWCTNSCAAKNTFWEFLKIKFTKQISVAKFEQDFVSRLKSELGPQFGFPTYLWLLWCWMHR